MNLRKLVQGIATIILIASITGCSVTFGQYDPIYEDRDHSTEVYWYSDTELGGNPYWGYWQGFYYYYGTAHFYPWWYYYTILPPYHYNNHTHVTVHCTNGYYVYGHRGNKFDNNKNRNYKASIKVITHKTRDKNQSVFPYNWKSSNSSRNTKINNNRIYIKPNPNHNTKPNINNNKPNKPRINNKRKPK